MSNKSSLSKTFVWIILGLLIVGLAGFGATNLSGTIRTVGTVGDQTISVDDYARDLQREIRVTEAQRGQAMTMEQAHAAGLDQVVLARLVALASLDHEVAEMGVSIGDTNLQQEILEIPSFQGVNGTFDREAYRFSLEQAGINEADFEADLRAESARTLAQGAIMSGVEMPEVLAKTVIDYVGARRAFTWARLGAETLETPVPAPTESDLMAHYDANPDSYRLPETKMLTYGLLTPDMLIDSVELDEDAARALYDQRISTYQLPERRLVERLVFGDESAANAAMAQLEVGGTTFELLVEDRGLALADVDLGDVTASDLGGAADPVFAAASGDVVGPLESDLGPALFRINGVLAARTTSFEEALPELRDELSADRARRMVDTEAQNIDDLLAGGATLEELPGETDMIVDQIAWSRNAFEGVAAYGAFRNAAAAVTADDYPEVVFLEDGGLFALRLDEILPERPQPFEDARAQVTADWTVEQTESALAAQAQTAIAALASGGDFVAAGLVPNSETGLTRTAFIDGTPADFMVQVFEMDAGEVRVITGGGNVHVVRLDEIQAAEETAETELLVQSINRELSQSLSQALFDAYVRDVQLRARPEIDQRALNAVRASFQ